MFFKTINIDSFYKINDSDNVLIVLTNIPKGLASEYRHTKIWVTDLIPIKYRTFINNIKMAGDE